MSINFVLNRGHELPFAGRRGAEAGGGGQFVAPGAGVARQDNATPWDADLAFAFAFAFVARAVCVAVQLWGLPSVATAWRHDLFGPVDSL